LEIILINLILNSADAMPEGGDLKIDYYKDLDFIKISVTDTGIGISAENLGSIFNPFFTTKTKRDGSGLGLYIVYNEMEKLEGRIVAESTVGEGTSFYLVFPDQKEEPNGIQGI
jgi:polar amino acid transport system substrate-binding protein